MTMTLDQEIADLEESVRLATRTLEAMCDALDILRAMRAAEAGGETPEERRRSFRLVTTA